MTQMSRRLTVLAGILVGCGAVFLIYASRDQSHLKPDGAEMEALVGRPLTEPGYRSSSRVQEWKDRARVWWIYFTLPIPNQMFVMPRGDTWTYRFRAPPSFDVPHGSPLACIRGSDWLTCEARGADGWQYSIEFVPSTGEGVLTTQFLPRP